MKSGKDGGDETLKKIKETLMAAALSSFLGGCGANLRNASTLNFLIETNRCSESAALGIESDENARAYFGEEGYLISMGDNNLQFRHYPLWDGDLLSAKNIGLNYSDANSDGILESAYMAGHSVSLDFASEDYKNLLRAIRKNEVQRVWERCWHEFRGPLHIPSL